MHEGASRRGWTGQGGEPGPWARTLRALAWLALLAVAGCASSEADDGGGAGVTDLPDSWQSGGQTGSLMPTCGLSPVARLQGVPASSAFVVYTSPCADAEGTELALLDADGNAIPVHTQPIGGGAVLIMPEVAIAPGSYTLSNVPAAVDEQDGSIDDIDGGTDAPTGVGDAGVVPPPGETVVVLPQSPAPVSLGELRSSGSCSAGLDLALDPSILPFLPSLALDLRVAGGAGATLRVVPFGTLARSPMDIVHLAIPLEQLSSTGGPVEVTVEAVLAGQPGVAASAELAITCEGWKEEQWASDDTGDPEGDHICSVTNVGVGRAPLLLAPLLWAWLVLGIRLRRRRLRRRLRSD